MKKIIHYCWFGKGKKSTIIEKCIKSWIKYCDDYEIMEWNEENSDINRNKFVKEAYDAKEWAFVSDYIRLEKLYEYGGIYLDTDMEVLESLDELIHDKRCIWGYHSINLIGTAFIKAEPGCEIIKELLALYEEKKFIDENGEKIKENNIYLITRELQQKYKIILNGSKFENREIVIYPEKYFGMDKNENNKYCIHHCEGSWMDKEEIYILMKAYRENYNFTLKLISKIIEKKDLDFKKLKNKKIAIYGDGEIGKVLIKILENNEIGIKCILNKETVEISREEIKEENIDCIINTVIHSWREVDKFLKENFRVDIIHINNLIDM